MGPISFEEIGTLSLNPKASPGKLILAIVLLLYLPLILHNIVLKKVVSLVFWQFYKYFINITQPLNIY